MAWLKNLSLWLLGIQVGVGALPQTTTSSADMSSGPAVFRPALIVVDFQEDFCPPSGSLAVTDGRTIAPIINNLLDLPFVLKVATKDFHPPNHVSFAANHPPPDNIPFDSYYTVHNPYNDSETDTTRLWPVHCVQGTPGVELIPEFNVSKVDNIIEKGTDARVEMYSAFEAPFRHPIVKEASSGLEQLLRDNEVTDVFVVGLAMDYCVKSTAIDAKKAGFAAYVVQEATKAVDPSDAGWGAAATEMANEGVPLISVDGEELEKVKKRL
ncbi:NAD(+) salvage pathway protein [Paramarasmius palmivorus]|uniref:nicotinamidase n=1 Tax=Paramarasmius palmivorus TaxID=297713 RepID=A0AAW0D8A5_9AGAR